MVSNTFIMWDSNVCQARTLDLLYELLTEVSRALLCSLKESQWWHIKQSRRNVNQQMIVFIMNVESTGNSLISFSPYPSFKLIHLIKMCWPSGWQKNWAPLPNLFAHWFLTQNRGRIENPSLFLLHTQRLNSSDGLLSAVLGLNGALQRGQTPRYPIHWSILTAATHTYFCHTCAMKSIA